MPILEIKALPQKSGVDVTAALKATCLAVASVADLSERQVWATWETLKPGHYLEGDTVAEIQPETTHPPIVNLIAFEGRSDSVIEAIITIAATTLAKELHLAAGNIFLTYNEVKSGRVYTGGTIRNHHTKLN